MINFIFVPGLNDSEDLHWQRLWIKQYDNSYCVKQDDWENPKAALWTKRLNKLVKSVKGPKIFIAHSLGCPTVINWADKYKNEEVIGAFLVAPPDIYSDKLPPNVKGYKAVKIKQLPFKSLIIASSNDQYCDLNKARDFAKQLGSSFINIGAKGHINLKSNLANWKEGREILNKFILSLDF